MHIPSTPLLPTRATKHATRIISHATYAIHATYPTHATAASAAAAGPSCAGLVRRAYHNDRYSGTTGTRIITRTACTSISFPGTGGAAAAAAAGKNGGLRPRWGCKCGWGGRRGAASCVDEGGVMGGQDGDGDATRLSNLRNIGISAHIDSGKTTLTERILYYTGRISSIHEVRGKDRIGAKMDSMELEREKGITIQSAATFCEWKGCSVNIIDTPGHVDFTIEVERALRVLDGAVLVVCSVGGVQSQTMTVDRQMKRYNVPRLIFINKLDRPGASPWRGIEQMRTKLKLNVAAVQVPIGLEAGLEGVVDLVDRKAMYNEGPRGETVRVEDHVPDHVRPLMEQKRTELIEKLADADDEVADHFLAETVPPVSVLRQAIRRATIKRTFCPVFMGSAYKNMAVQALLDGVVAYLPDPSQVENTAIDLVKAKTEGEEAAKFVISSRASEPFVGLVFKLEEGRYGQLTYIRVYRGTLRKGMVIYNARTGKRTKVPRLVRMHSNEMEDVAEIQGGEICALFGVECSSGDSFTDGSSSSSSSSSSPPIAMTSIHVPSAVMSLAVTPTSKQGQATFTKALARFQREDPTFRVSVDPESRQVIMSGMGELHLEIYLERMRREYNCDTVAGKPRVAFRETITRKAEFAYTHKKQTGGSGQYGRVVGYIEPYHGDGEGAPSPSPSSASMEFVNRIKGNAIPPNLVPACEKGFYEALEKGRLTGHPVQNVRMVLTDGQTHPVDSNELAFRTATIQGFREAMRSAGPMVLEPVMRVEVTIPTEFLGPVLGGLNRRGGTITDSVGAEEYTTITAEVPLNNMFGYSTEIRSLTQGKGEFTMEYLKYAPTTSVVQEQLVQAYLSE